VRLDPLELRAAPGLPSDRLIGDVQSSAPLLALSALAVAQKPAAPAAGGGAKQKPPISVPVNASDAAMIAALASALQVARAQADKRRRWRANWLPLSFMPRRRLG